jgi:hypothetical protein
VAEQLGQLAHLYIVCTQYQLYPVCPRPVPCLYSACCLSGLAHTFSSHFPTCLVTGPRCAASSEITSLGQPSSGLTPQELNYVPMVPMAGKRRAQIFLALAILAICATDVFASRLVLMTHNTPRNSPSNTSSSTNSSTVPPTPPGGPNPKIGQSAQFDICQPNPADCQAPPPGTALGPGVNPAPDDGPENLCWYKGVWYLSNNSRGSRMWGYYFAEELNQYCCPESCKDGETMTPNGVCRSFWSKDECY